MFGTWSRRLDRARRSGRTRFIRGFGLAVRLSAAGVAIGSGIEAVTIPPVYAGLAAAATVALAVDHGAAFATGRTVLRLLEPPARDADAAATLLRIPPGDAHAAVRVAIETSVTGLARGVVVTVVCYLLGGLPALDRKTPCRERGYQYV